MSSSTFLANSQWPDGTARSNANAFSILYEPRCIPDSARAKQKTGPKPVLRVNKNTYTPTTQADRDRNAAIGGRGPMNSKDQ